MTGSIQLPAGIGRLGLAFIAFGLAHILMKVAFGIEVVGLKLTGDENAYVDAAKALSNLIRDIIRLSPPDTIELQRNVVGNGWFMPGMPLLLTPLYLAFPDAGIASLRVYLGCLSFGLWLWTLVSVHNRLGKLYALALMIFPSLAPLWILFSFTAWGDLYAGLLLIILLSHLFTVLQNLRQDIALSLADGVRIGALSAACLYLRSSVLPLIPLLFATLLLASLVFPKRRWKMASTIGCSAAIVTFLAILLPWSIVASKSFGARVLTTTTVPLSMAVAFGNKEALCFGSCGRGNLWFRAVAYSRVIADEAGIDELSVQKNMASYAMRNATPRSYSRNVLENFGRYAFNPTSFTHVFIPDPAKTDGQDAIRWSFVNRATAALYYVFMFFMVVAWLMIVRRKLESQFASVLIKMFSAGMLLQPFVHVSGGRYWTTFAPLFALSLGLILTVLAEGRTSAAVAGIAPNLADTESWQLRLMVWVQVLFVVCLVTAAIALFWLGRS